LIATAPIKSMTPDVLDEHFYMSAEKSYSDATHYDKTDRNGPKIFVGEWATREGEPTPNLQAALGDSAWMTGMERNSDIIIMSCYAPLFVNVNPGGRQCAVNLIGYDALISFGSPSYYVQKMFSNNRGDVVLPAKFDPLPTLTPEEIPVAPQPPAAAGNNRGNGGRGPTPPTGTFDGLYVSATRDNGNGDVILKLVNVQVKAQLLQIDLQGVPTIKKDASGEVISGELGAINTVAQRLNIVPRQVTIRNAGTKFSYELPQHSVSVIRLRTR